MLTKVCKTSTTVPQTLCSQKSRGAAQAHLPARLQDLWGLRLFAATLLALAACAKSDDLEAANLSVDSSNQEGELKNRTYKEIFKKNTHNDSGRCLLAEYPIFVNKRCLAPCINGYYYHKLRCYLNRKKIKISDRKYGHCGGGKKKKCIYSKNNKKDKKCCSCDSGSYIFTSLAGKNLSANTSFCHDGHYDIKDISKSIKSYSRCNVNIKQCKDGNHTNCEYNDKLQKCTWKGGLITQLPAGTNYFCEDQKDTEGNIHCYDVRSLENKPSKQNLLKPIKTSNTENKTCPPEAPILKQGKCREKCYGNADDIYGIICYQNRSPASSEDCKEKAAFSFGGKNLCCPAGKLFKNGKCYTNIYRLNTRNLKPFCHVFDSFNCGITDESNHCAWRNGKCVWNLPEYGYPSCRNEGGAVICKPTETP